LQFGAVLGFGMLSDREEIGDSFISRCQIHHAIDVAVRLSMGLFTVSSGLYNFLLFLQLYVLLLLSNGLGQ